MYQSSADVFEPVVEKKPLKKPKKGMIQQKDENSKQTNKPTGVFGKVGKTKHALI